ncbi:MAG TPA: hypothetical protein VJ812_01565 [Gemmatimonadaceae bacterium]|jgi:hypothetical protein|nr:hypothetical protein [Gemmatimonadaceae bacterium]
MLKIVFFLLVGGMIGYFAGFNDAKVHRQHIISRVIEKYTDPEKMSGDIDKKMEAVGK